MFESKVRDVVIPQYEHGRLAGTLAQYWGNARFDRPAVPFDSFVLGVTLHDWHYGLLDNLSISRVSEADWLIMARRGLETRLDDPVADVVAKLHLRRLYGFNLSPQRQAAIDEIDGLVALRIAETGFTRAQFEWADAITRFCDYAAFFFAFEAPCEHTFHVRASAGSDEESLLGLRVLGGGEAVVTPWPFTVERLDGILLAYQAAGYPERLAPVVVPYRFSAGTG